MFPPRHLIPIAGAAIALCATGQAAERLDAGIGIGLRLDHTFQPGPRRVDVRSPETARLLSFGVSEVRGRINRVRDDAARLERENLASAARLAEREQLIGRLEQVLQAQDGAIGRLNETLEVARPTVPPPAPVAQARTPVAPTPSVSASPVSSPADRSISLDRVLDLTPERVVVEGALVALVLVALGWALALRSRIRRAGELHSEPFAPVGLREKSLAPGVVPATAAALPGIEVEEVVESPSPAEPVAAPAAPEPSNPRTETMAPEPAPPRPAPGPEPDAASAGEDPPAWTQTMIRRKAADPDALREVDTLIAFENHETAARLLEALIAGNPENPEYRLRLVHVRGELGDADAAAREEEILAAMMDGPLSETMNRVKEVGRGLLPGHKLFGDRPAKSDQELLDEIFEAEAAGGADVDAFNDTIFDLDLSPDPGDGPGEPPGARSAA